MLLSVALRSARGKSIAYPMALAEFVKFKEPLSFFDTDPAVHAPVALEHNGELTIPVEPVLKVFAIVRTPNI